MATVQFELVSPARLLVSEEVEMVVVPGSEGNFGVLPDHAPMLSTIRPGVIDIYNKGKVTQQIFVAGGFADVTETSCTVLAEEAIPVEEIDRHQVEARIKAAEDTYAEADDAHTQIEARIELRIGEAMLEAINPLH